MSKDDICGEGFIKQTGPDGDYCVFDYETAASKFGSDKGHLKDDAEHYWEGLERQNLARKKFGLKPLTPEEYVALKVQSEEIGAQNLDRAISELFQKFDSNNDGVITFDEFKQGLLQSNNNNKKNQQKKKEISEASIRKVFEYYDTSGDGLLQLDEFVTLDRIRNKLNEEEQQTTTSSSSSSTSNTNNNNNNNNNNMFRNFLNNLAFHFEDTCETNMDCDHPEVCCDFGYKKMCCRSGKMAKELELEYAMVPVPQQVHYN